MTDKLEAYARRSSVVQNSVFKPSLLLPSLCLLLAFLSACEPHSALLQSAQLELKSAETSSQVNLQNANQHWQYIQVDNNKKMWGDWDQPDWLRYFGLAYGDINGDGLQDIVSGRYVYLQDNSGAQPTASKWQKLDLGDNVDGILVIDVDGDKTLDIVAQALPNLYWYELNTNGTFDKTEIGEVPATTHVNSQGFTTANIVGDLNKEFIIAGNGNLYAFSAQKTEGRISWRKQRIAINTSDEGIGVGDVDGDGDMDIAAGRRPDGEAEPKEVVWFENPGHMDTSWQEHYVGKGSHPIDRVGIADLNGDGLGDIVFTEERYPGLEPDAQMVMFTQQNDASWLREVLVTQFSMNNLDIGDVDQDGDLDIVTAEHKGEALETELWRNDGKGSFTQTVIDNGKESHLGTQLVDIDGDGDLDLISAGWDQHQFVHIWLNPLISNVVISEVQWAQPDQAKRAHFKIDTPSASYLLDAAGGGFSSIIDLQGKDWVNFKMKPWGDYPAAAAGAFRGIPNLVHGQGEDSGAGHPGFDKMQTVQTSANTLLSTSNSGEWQWQYRFSPTAVHLEVKKSPENGQYWFLYEGTPGANFDLANTSYGTDSLGHQTDRPDFYKGSIKQGQFSWAYFSHNQSAQSLFVAHKNQDQLPDMMSYLGNTEAGVNSTDGMVVFGFGRDAKGQAQLTGQNSFVFGLSPIQVNDTQQHNKIKQYIQAQL